MRKFAIFGLILGSSLLLTGCRNPLTGQVVTLPFIEKPPTEVVRLMQAQMASEQTLRAVTNSSLEATGGTAPLSASTLRQRITVDVNRPDAEAFVENATSLGIVGSSFDATSESFYGDGKLFFRFTQLPILPFLNLQAVQNEWFVRDIAAETAGLKDDLRIDEDALKSLAPQVDALVRQASLFTVKERLLDEAIDGVKSYHYRVAPDETGIQTFAQAMYATVQLAVPTLKDTAFDSASFSSFLTTFRDARFEVWIGKDDFRLRKFSVAGSYSQNTEQLQYTVVTTFSHFGERFVATAPATAKPADEFAKALDLSKFQDQINTLLPYVGGSIAPEFLKQFQSLSPSS